jgi:hypothetical protein
MEKYRDEFVVEFYHYVKNLEDAHRFLGRGNGKRHQDALKVWFIKLFNGDYGARYLADLERVGMAHVKINLHAHYVNAAFHFVKQYVNGIPLKR